MRFDVIVIGAGPGGSTCARYLAKSGFSVCLIDKDEFPRDKPCGGGFSYSILERFPYLKSRESEFVEGICRIGVIHSPNRRITLKGRADMAVTLRTKFDYVLFNEAIIAGAVDYSGSRVKRIRESQEDVTVVTTKGDMKANYIIGSDGVTSLVARDTLLHKHWLPNQITACRVVEIPIKRQEIVERYGSEREYHFFANVGGSPGYGWVFPKESTVNVGLGLIGTHSAGLPKTFLSFIRLLKKMDLLSVESDISSARGALVPTAGPIKKTYSDRCLLVGDSAGMVSPLTGGGIHYAMSAGRIAAGAMKCAFHEGLSSSSIGSMYQNRWMKAFGGDFGTQLMAQRVFTSNFVDLLFEIGNRDIKIQEMVSKAMAESSEEKIQVMPLLTRTIAVCLKSAMHLTTTPVR